MSELTPREVVEALDKYIVGQDDAKRAVAVAVRNRFRRSMVDEEMKREILPKNILMIGPTGVGKTEIARRLARLVEAPFLKVEATKFTEVGYVGRDVESIIRDLVDTSVRMVQAEEMNRVWSEAEKAARRRLIDTLVPTPGSRSHAQNPFEMIFGETTEAPSEEDEPDWEAHRQRRRRVIKALDAGELEDEKIEIEIEDQMPSMVEIFGGSGVEELGFNLQNLMGNMMPQKKKQRRVTVAEARNILQTEEANKLVDKDAVTREAIRRAEQDGMVFLDELDKIAGEDQGATSPDVSREGVQRDILPIVEGTTVMTKYGPVSTEHILFVAAGAFHTSKPSDLIPELQGRLPIRVELDALSGADLRRILVEPRNSLVRQYTELLAVDGVTLVFEESGVHAVARIAEEVNTNTENIGARRLHTIMEKLLQEVSYLAPDEAPGRVVVDGEYVERQLAAVVSDRDLSRYIL
ncbi:MAG: ATP-dependent protease ATPase subunit HslU [Bacillota bacterium]